MAKLRGMAADFRTSFDEMARQSELDELRKEVEAMRRGQFADVAEHASGVEISQTFDDINQSLTDAGVQLHPPMSYQYNEMSAPEPEAAAPKRKRAPAKPKASKPKAAVAAAAAKAPAARKPRARKAEPKA
jgi:sec-independent protein translocase protein TatB